MLTFAAFSIAALVGSGTTHAQEALTTEQALQRFEERIGDYAVLRARIAASVPPVGVLSDPARIHEQVDALAASIRAARSGAQIGELFTADVRLVLRTEVRRALADAHIAVEDLIDDLEGEARSSADVPPVEVNGRFPWEFGTAMPPVLLDALPALPKEVQYRFIGRDLALVDIDANLVVDVLPDALPLGRSQDISLCKS